MEIDAAPQSQIEYNESGRNQYYTTELIAGMNCAML